MNYQGKGKGIGISDIFSFGNHKIIYKKKTRMITFIIKFKISVDQTNIDKNRYVDLYLMKVSAYLVKYLE